jgi:hypothetical protein
MDTWLQSKELLRDPSHVRDRSASEWSQLIAQAGFHLLEQETFPTRLPFEPWVERMRTPAERVTAIRSLQARAPAEVRTALQLEPDGSFTPRRGCSGRGRCSSRGCPPARLPYEPGAADRP